MCGRIKMILSVTFSKPVSNIQDFFEHSYQKIKVNIQNSNGKTSYFAQMFTQTQVFHKHFLPEELDDFIEKNAGKTFKNCLIKSETEEIQILANKKGKITKLVKKVENQIKNQNQSEEKSLKNIKMKTDFLEGNQNKKKNYLLEENTNIPFLQLLGIMNSNGKVVAAKYDKFKQINRFLEFIDDVLPEVLKSKTEDDKTIRIIDFGSGKSYLTFAVQYYLSTVKKLPCYIEGLDLKVDVINYCNEIAQKLNLENLKFRVGNISDYSGEKNPDIVITLHACDTATDFALKYAVERKSKVILSVPCCQHQINTQLNKNKTQLVKDDVVESFLPLLKWGIIKEKFSSLLTDALRGEWLESKGYKVQMLEFIDIEHTPKNIMIRAVKKSETKEENLPKKTKTPKIIDVLNIEPEIFN